MPKTFFWVSYIHVWGKPLYMLRQDISLGPNEVLRLVWKASVYQMHSKRDAAFERYTHKLTEWVWWGISAMALSPMGLGLFSVETCVIFPQQNTMKVFISLSDVVCSGLVGHVMRVGQLWNMRWHQVRGSKRKKDENGQCGKGWQRITYYPRSKMLRSQALQCSMENL